MTLLAKLAKIEAQLQMIEADPVEERLQLRQHGPVSRPRKPSPTWRRRLDVMARRAEIEGRYGDLDGPSAYVDPHRDIVKEVDEQFGPSDSRPAAKAGDKSL